MLCLNPCYKPSSQERKLVHRLFCGGESLHHLQVRGGGTIIGKSQINSLGSEGSGKSGDLWLWCHQSKYPQNHVSGSYSFTWSILILPMQTCFNWEFNLLRSSIITIIYWSCSNCFPHIFQTLDTLSQIIHSLLQVYHHHPPPDNSLNCHLVGRGYLCSTYSLWCGPHFQLFSE